MSTTTTVASAPSLVPALPPPDGVTSNFEHPDSLMWAMNVSMAVAIPLATLFFGLRCYVRLWIKRQWIVEDCTQPNLNTHKVLDARLTGT